MKVSGSLKVALKTSDLVVQNYVIGLESQNAKMKAEIGKLEAQNIGQKHEIVALKKELKKKPVLAAPVFNVVGVKAENGRPA